MHGSGAPDGGVTWTSRSTPAKAELVPTLMVLLFCTVTFVSRPITAEGLMTNTLPLPLLVFMPALMVPPQTPEAGIGTHVPLEQSVPAEHVAPPVIAPVPEFTTQCNPPVPP